MDFVEPGHFSCCISNHHLKRKEKIFKLVLQQRLYKNADMQIAEIQQEVMLVELSNQIRMQMCLKLLWTAKLKLEGTNSLTEKVNKCLLSLLQTWSELLKLGPMFVVLYSYRSCWMMSLPHTFRFSPKHLESTAVKMNVNHTGKWNRRSLFFIISVTKYKQINVFSFLPRMLCWHSEPIVAADTALWREAAQNEFDFKDVCKCLFSESKQKPLQGF